MMKWIIFQQNLILQTSGEISTKYHTMCDTHIHKCTVHSIVYFCTPDISEIRICGCTLKSYNSWPPNVTKIFHVLNMQRNYS